MFADKSKGRRAWLLACPGCGKTFVVIRPADKSERIVCRSCGTTIPLSNPRRVLGRCRACSALSQLWTNATAPEVWYRCMSCGCINTATVAPDGRAYETAASKDRRVRTESGQPVPELTGVAATRLALMVLHDKFGFGRDQAARFTAQLKSLSEEYQRGEISMGDVTSALEEDGIAIEEDRHGHDQKG